LKPNAAIGALSWFSIRCLFAWLQAVAVPYDKTNTNEDRDYQKPEQIARNSVGTKQTPFAIRRNLISRHCYAMRSRVTGTKLSHWDSYSIAIVKLNEVGRAAQP
jgi:hypothetical protein